MATAAAVAATAAVVLVVLVLVLALHHRSDRRGFVFALSFQDKVEVAFSLIHQLLTTQRHGCAWICQG